MLKRLVTHGCSFAYGQELTDPLTQAWPALVANQLNIECENLSIPGYSNDGIVEDLVATDIDPTTDLVIVMWTWQHRMLIVDNKGWFTCSPGNSDSSHRRHISNMLMIHANQEWLRERWLTQVILLQQYFKSRNIQYLFVNAFDNNENGDTTLHSQVDTDHFLGWPNFNFNVMTDDYSKLPLGHPNAEAHQAMANIITSRLKELYDTKTI